VLFLLGCPNLSAAGYTLSAPLPEGATFEPFTDGAVWRIVLQPDGKILVGGPFTMLNGQVHGSIARLNPDGGVDLSFTAQTDGAVRAILVQPDGKILIGGEFTTVNGQPRNYLARLNPNGSLDAGFNLNVDNQVFSSYPTVCHKSVQKVMKKDCELAR
jgi:uncharacterized delta-60 repeat protein